MHNAEKYIRERLQDINNNNTRVKNLEVAREVNQDLRYSLWHGFIDCDTYDNLKQEIDKKVSVATETQINKISKNYEKQTKMLSMRKTP